MMLYDCMIIGGGIAGLQAAIQLGRYRYRVIVIDSNDGRSNLCRCYHNLLGWPDGVSGETLRMLGKQQAEGYGVHFVSDRVTSVSEDAGEFEASTEQSRAYRSRRLLFATGIKDNIPMFPELIPCMGISIFVCPDCDGYEVSDKPALVIGSGDAGANMALALTHWSQEITLVNHGKAPIGEKLLEQLYKKGVRVIVEKIVSVACNGTRLEGIRLEGGLHLRASQGFLALGGNEVHTDLSAGLGVLLEKNRHIKVDPRTKMTNVKHVWAAGDIVAHSEQVAIAMGDGVQAAIWMHKSLQGE
ncbi:thioredoxin reductase [Bacillus tianshenii]|uniref:Thioredoxin reductase n=2 Tax=Sutcliffiella tianshenii TaxID=1463404 RepID=A0ABS2NVS2_9BACI|nr:thioredoxin reductase [Bacillus tianshenii]